MTSCLEYTLIFKIKVSVNKLSRHFGPNSGAIDDVSKVKVNTIQESDMVIDAHPDEWLHNRMYILTQKDKEVSLSKDEWLNDQLICEEIGTPFTFQC